MAKLTTHVLDIYSGKPGYGIKVELYYYDNNNRKKLNNIILNADGRADKALIEGPNFVEGNYEIVFFVGEYFKKLEGLPNIIGNHENFFDLYKVLILNSFAINEVKSFYYFNIGRWDVILKDGKIIKLPPKNYESSIKNFNEMKSYNNLNKYSIFDYRIKDQLILN